MGNAVIWCDICQDVCPWNRKAAVTALGAFQPRKVVAGFEVADEAAPQSSTATLFTELEWLASLSQEEFSTVFRHSAVKRAKWRGLVECVRGFGKFEGASGIGGTRTDCRFAERPGTFAR